MGNFIRRLRRIPKLPKIFINHIYKRRGKIGGGLLLSLGGAGVIQLQGFWQWIGYGVIAVGLLITLLCIFWRHHDDIDSLEDSFDDSNVVWGMW